MIQCKVCAGNFPHHYIYCPYYRDNFEREYAKAKAEHEMFKHQMLLRASKKKVVYIVGALGNPNVPQFANELEQHGFEPFADWYTPGPEADTFLLKYAKERGWGYKQALKSYAAKHVFEFDKSHIDRADICVMLMPAGKSAHLEIGYASAKKPTFILFDKEPERFDVMYQFVTDIFFDRKELFEALEAYK